MDRIILASASPRRKQLLEWAEVLFDVIPSDSEELIPDDLPISEIPEYLASQKESIVRKKTGSGKIILAADTIVVLNDQILGKPLNRADALRMLSLLSGSVHEVITGVVLTSAKREIRFKEKTKVRFHHLTQAGIEHYVDTYRPFDKAGAYAIQEWIGVTGIHSIEGDFYNVMGLPVSRVLQELKSMY
jgi:septum formation protein